MGNTAKLSGCQEAMLVSGYTMKNNDNCVRGNRNTMRALIDKGLAKPTGGFGRKWGTIIELTEDGVAVAKSLVEQNDTNRTI